MNGELLKYVLHRNGYTIKDVATILGITPQALSRKISGAASFKTTEIKTIKESCGVTNAEICDIFF